MADARLSPSIDKTQPRARCARVYDVLDRTAGGLPFGRLAAATCLSELSLLRALATLVDLDMIETHGDRWARRRRAA